MTFSVFIPPAAADKALPIVMYLSGLTCTDDNFTQKAGAQRSAARLGLALVAPDTSPRGLGVPGEDDSYDFGTGAGFYLNATRVPWQQYRMYEYITEELPSVLKEIQGLDLTRVSLTGHSMGGHGALTIGLKNPGAYKSLSAFSPICNPTAVPWGVKAFTGYLGEDRETWKQYDATELAKAYDGPSKPILIDQGTEDTFLKEQLHPEAFEAAAKGKLDLTLRMQDGYDHSYFFIATFVDDHLDFHAKYLHA